MQKPSPMMQQYFLIKEANKDCIIFYRLGDFYEMFYEDAVLVSDMLGLTLTARDSGNGERAPMCGVPFHAADLYIDKIVSRGYKVAICEQVSTPQKGKLVEREIVKIITKGTVTNDDFIDEKSNNFIMSVYLEGQNAGISWADITTGEFFAKNFTDDLGFVKLQNYIIKINPSQIIANKKAKEFLDDTSISKQKVIPTIEYFRDSEFNTQNAKGVLEKHFNVKSFVTFGFNEDDCCFNSSGALISYLYETQKTLLSNINAITYSSDDNLMMIDHGVIRNLELIKTFKEGKRYGSLLWLLDKTKTSMGARKLQSWVVSPLKDIDKINYRLLGVESFYNNTLIRKSVFDLLGSVKDVGRISGKISNGNLVPKDCLNLAKSLAIIPTIKFQLSGINAESIVDIVEKMSDYEDICKLINDAIYDESNEKITDVLSVNKKKKKQKIIKEGFNLELDKLRTFKDNSVRELLEIESRERENTGIKTLKIGYNNVFGYYIEVSKSFKDNVPYYYERRQTIANGERFVTQELRDLEYKILTSESQAEVLELEIYNKIKGVLLENVPKLKRTADALAELDIYISLATVARENNFIKPNILEEGSALEIVDGRHPVVEATMKQKFVPNDAYLDNNENRTILITGPNMAGKSTYMRQVALITLMAHVGSFVPASKANIPLTDKIFTRIGASDNLISDQSTFMVEMSETADILKNATKNSLIILDEIGRGTSTYDGLSIAWAVMEYINENIKAKTLFATHYHELTNLENVLKGVKNYKINVKELNGTIIFLRKIMRGATNRSFGIEVADLAGVKKEVTDRAKKLLKSLENKSVDANSIVSNDDIYENETVSELSEVERIIKELDINNMSPMHAFNVLCDLQEKVKDK